MATIAPISGIFLAAETDTNRRDITPEDKTRQTAADNADTGADFAKVFDKACADLRAAGAIVTASGA